MHVPDPVLPDTHLATPEGDAVRYRDRIDLVLVDDDDRYWLGEHRVVDEFAADDELLLDERGVARVLGVGRDRAGDDDHRRRSTPRCASIRPAFRRTRRPALGAVEKEGAARRLALAGVGT